MALSDFTEMGDLGRDERAAGVPIEYALITAVRLEFLESYCAFILRRAISSRSLSISNS